MRLLRKPILVFMLCIALLIPLRQSQAIIPLAPVAAFLLEVSGSSILVGDLVAGMSGVIAGVLWYECNKMQWGGNCDTKPSSMPADQAPGSPGITIKLAPEAKRSNPDPSKFNDPAAGARDVTPKATQPVTPGSAPSDPNDSGSGGGKYWQGGPAGSVIGGSGYGVAYAALVSNYCVGNYASGCELRNCVTGSVDVGLPEPRATYQCEGYATPGTMSCSPGADGKCLVGYRNQYTSATQIAGTPPKVCGTGQYSVQGGACTSYPNGPSTCPVGYSMSTDGQSCNLTNAAAVKKPDTTPCEVLWDANGKAFTTDPANQNCSGLPSGATVSTESNDGTGGSMTVKGNTNGGFDITQDKGNGQSTTVHTGPYDSVSGGYSIINTTNTVPAGQTPDGKGDGCGVPGKGPCDVQFSAGAAVDAAGNAAQQGVTDDYNTLKGSLDNVDPTKFDWSFIPQIPTASCENPRVKNPLITQYLDVDICGFFNKFSFFFNGVLAVLCIYGCAREVQQAHKT